MTEHRTVNTANCADCPEQIEDAEYTKRCVNKCHRKILNVKTHDKRDQSHIQQQNVQFSRSAFLIIAVSFDKNIKKCDLEPCTFSKELRKNCWFRFNKHTTIHTQQRQNGNLTLCKQKLCENRNCSSSQSSDDINQTSVSCFHKIKNGEKI